MVYFSKMQKKKNLLFINFRVNYQITFFLVENLDGKKKRCLGRNKRRFQIIYSKDQCKWYSCDMSHIGQTHKANLLETDVGRTRSDESSSELWKRHVAKPHILCRNSRSHDHQSWSKIIYIYICWLEVAMWLWMDNFTWKCMVGMRPHEARESIGQALDFRDLRTKLA